MLISSIYVNHSQTNAPVVCIYSWQYIRCNLASLMHVLRHQKVEKQRIEVLDMDKMLPLKT